MKKYIYSFLILLISCLVMISCGDDDATASKGSPAQGAVGTYSGTWHQDNLTAKTSTDFQGTVILTAQEKMDYVTYIELQGSGDEVAKNIDGKRTYANIVNRTTGYAFSNASTKVYSGEADALGEEIDGTIEDGQLTVKVLKVINKRVGKKTTQQTTIYTFKGTKTAV